MKRLLTLIAGLALVVTGAVAGSAPARASNAPSSVTAIIKSLPNCSKSTVGECAPSKRAELRSLASTLKAIAREEGERLAFNRDMVECNIYLTREALNGLTSKYGSEKTQANRIKKMKAGSARKKAQRNLNLTRQYRKNLLTLKKHSARAKTAVETHKALVKTLNIKIATY